MLHSGGYIRPYRPNAMSFKHLNSCPLQQQWFSYLTNIYHSKSAILDTAPD